MSALTLSPETCLGPASSPPHFTDTETTVRVAGQRLVFALSARELIPYLPDAVPGWFQAVLALYDAKGNEIEFVDDGGATAGKRLGN